MFTPPIPSEGKSVSVYWCKSLLLKREEEFGLQVYKEYRPNFCQNQKNMFEFSEADLDTVR